MLSQVDPPRHTRFRRLVAGFFTGPAVNRLQGYLDTHIVDLLNRLPASRPVDFMTHFAIPLPIDVIADQLGVPREDAPLIKRWTDAIIETLNAMITAERKLACTREIVDFQRYFVQLRERKIREPRNDILSTLAVANTDEGVALTTEEFIAICAQLMVAGNETTRNHLAKGAWLLTQRADLLQALHDEPTLAARFVDETLRLESPVQGLFRRCTRDYPLGGAVIPAGARVVLLYGAANRDPREFPDPAELRLDRPNVTRHMAFGHGIHGCVGRVLATAELTAAFRHLTQRFEKIELDPSACEPAHKPHFSLRGLDSLSLILTRRM